MRSLNAGDHQCITMISGVLKFVIENEQTQIDAISKLNVVPLLLSIIESSDDKDLDELSGVFSFLETLVIKNPDYAASIHVIEIIYQKLSTLQFLYPALLSILKVLLAAVNQLALREIVIHRMNDLNLITKINECLQNENNNSLKYSRNSFCTCLLFLTNICVDTSFLISKLSGISFSSTIGKIMKIYHFNKQLFDIGSNLLIKINNNEDLSNAMVEISMKLKESIQNNSYNDITYYLYSLIGFVSYSSGRAMLLSTDIITSLLQIMTHFDYYLLLIELALDIIKLIASDSNDVITLAINRFVMNLKLIYLLLFFLFLLAHIYSTFSIHFSLIDKYL